LLCCCVSFVAYRWLYSNQLTALPPQLGQLQRLRKLWADRNQLASVPNELGDCAELQVNFELIHEYGQHSNSVYFCYYVK
jgi:hypothetical protein